MNNHHQNKSNTNFEVEVKELDNDSALLSTHTLQITLPIKELPRNIKTGDKLIISISEKNQFMKNKETTAKEILNTLLE